MQRRDRECHRDTLVGIAADDVRRQPYIGVLSEGFGRPESDPHSDAVVRLYLQESFTFLLLTSEAAVALAPAAKAKKS